MSEQTNAPSAEQTRLALIRAALTLFGERGFDGTSTRQIAAEAGANIGSIAYHFGGKDGLRAACADHIVETVQAIAAQAMPPVLAGRPEAIDPRMAETLLLGAMERLVGFIVRPEAGPFVQFILRELAQPTSALDRIYDGFFEPTHRRLCMLWERATGEAAESERTRMTVFTLVGQIVYFRIGRPAVMRRLGWEEMGEREAKEIAALAQSNLRAVLAARRGNPP